MVGSAAFRHESGLHCAGLLRDARTYEPFAPETVGRRREPFAVGWQSGAAALGSALHAAGVDASDAEVRRLLPLVRGRARTLRRTLTPAELISLHQATLNTGDR